MGSHAELPLASAPSLVLTIPTDSERRRTWKMTHGMWGNALDVDTYLDREAYLTNVPLAMDSGMTHWILTDGTLPPDERPLLSSCESIRKPAVAAWPPSGCNGEKAVVVDGVAHGIASVFTDPQYRGRGYAGRMLRELGPRLKTWQVESADDSDSDKKKHSPSTSTVSLAAPTKTSLFSVLYSDIGKTFYASKGWLPFPSSHLAFAPDAAAEAEAQASPEVAPLGYHELAELCAVDEQLVRARLARKAERRAAAGGHRGPCVAIVPNLPTMLWHLMREDYMTKHIFQKTPAVRGAVVSVGTPLEAAHVKGHRIWAIWTRGYYAGLKAPISGNTLHILRVVLEDVYDDDADADAADQTASEITPAHVAGFRAILRRAQAEAALWHCGTVQLWNPTPALAALAAKSGVASELVHREKDSIASLMWNGDGATEDVEWVANEKYGWC